MPLRALLEQFAPDFPGFCKVGTGYNKQIDLDATGFIAVTDSVYLLKNLEFDAILVDEAHHPLPTGMPKCKELYQLSATHKDEPDFRYSMGQAIEDGILSHYDITVPVISKHHAYVCLAGLLLKQPGRFRRVLAYCNTVAEAKRFQMVLEELGLAAWHINARTKPTIRQAVMAEFAGELQKPVHVLVTVEVLGEGSTSQMPTLACLLSHGRATGALCRPSGEFYAGIQPKPLRTSFYLPWCYQM